MKRIGKTIQFWAIAAPIFFLALSNSSRGQTQVWSYTIPTPSGYRYYGDEFSSSARRTIESLNDGYGGSIWVVHFCCQTNPPLDRIVWLSSRGVALYTNDIVGPPNSSYLVRFVRLTRTDVILQLSFQNFDHTKTTNSLVRLKKSRNTILQTETPFSPLEDVGPVAAQNGTADNSGILSRQLAVNENSEVTAVIIRRYSN
jgi:hypothetical protein